MPPEEEGNKVALTGLWRSKNTVQRTAKLDMKQVKIINLSIANSTIGIATAVKTGQAPGASTAYTKAAIPT